jgi:hypothetical protein
MMDFSSFEEGGGLKVSPRRRALSEIKKNVGPQIKPRSRWKVYWANTEKISLILKLL